MLHGSIYGYYLYIMKYKSLKDKRWRNKNNNEHHEMVFGQPTPPYLSGYIESNRIMVQDLAGRTPIVSLHSE